jgi:hypothetical protein
LSRGVNSVNKVFVTGYRSSEVPLESPGLPCASLKIKAKVIKTNPRRKMYRQLPFGAVDGVVPICVDTNDANTAIDGIIKRFGRELPKPEIGFHKRLLRYVDRWCSTYLRPLDTIMTFEQWLETTDYNDSRKYELRRSYDALNGASPSTRMCKRIKSFVKTESYPCFKHARIINSRSDSFKVFSGPIFKSIENAVFDLPWFVKHHPVNEWPAMVARLYRDGAIYLGTDFTAFESHFTAEVMRACEFRVYRYMLRFFPDYYKLISNTLAGRNVGRFRCGVEFEIMARRMSGEMCTSLGNSLTNLLLWSYYADNHGISWDGLVEGDDGLFAVYGGSPPSAEDYARMGFTIKMEHFTDPCYASFCGITCVGDQLIRNPLRFVSKFGWTSSCIQAGKPVLNSLLRAKALSAIYETPQCPVIRAIAERALMLTEGFEPRFEGSYFHVQEVVQPFCPSESTRLLFAEMFSISVESQLYLERRIMSSFDLNFLFDYMMLGSDNIHMFLQFLDHG